MEGVKFLKSTQIIILGICFALATIFSTIILSQALMKAKKFSTEVIDVTGSAEKYLASDKIVWTASFSRRAPQLVAAFKELKSDLKEVMDYFKAKGVKEEEVVISPVSSEILYKKDEKGNDTNEIEGYVLTQGIEIESRDVTRVSEVSRNSTELIEKGIEFISAAPQYFYTRLAELKLEMLAEASRDARERAERMVSAAGNKIGPMRSARMGIFQITPANSYEISDWGMNDTSSLEKKVTAVVHAQFAISEKD